MKLRARIAVMGGFLFAASPVVAQDAANVQIHAEHVSGGIHMLTGSGGNIGVSAGPDGLLIVDDQFAPLADKIKAALAALSDSDVSFVLNTHWHPDHTDGNVVFGREAPIIAHVNVRRILETGAHVLGRDVPPAPPEALPVVTFGDSLSIYFNGEEIRVIHYPNGHTDGDAVIFFLGSNVVHMGDHFFPGRFPFVDLGNGGSVQGTADNVAAVLGRVSPDTRIIPGHGSLSNRADLAASRKMLIQVRDRVRKLLEDGLDRDQVVAAAPTKDHDDAFGGGFMTPARFTAIVYESLKNEN